MTDTITLTGLVATEPKNLTTGEGLAITSFRLASAQRRFDRKTNAWVDAGTNWYTVSAFRRLALGAAASISKGDRVIVTGRLRLRDWANADKTGMSIEVTADALGHDLNWGTASYVRTMSSTAGLEAAGAAPEDTTPSGGGFPTEGDGADLGAAGSEPLTGVEHDAEAVPAGASPGDTPF